MPCDIVPWDCFGDFEFGVFSSWEMSIYDKRLGLSCCIAFRFGVDEVTWVSFSKYYWPDCFFYCTF